MHYYFGSREQLQREVAEERVLPLLQSVQKKLRGAGDVPALIEGFVSAIGEAVAENPRRQLLKAKDVSGADLQRHTNTLLKRGLELQP